MSSQMQMWVESWHEAIAADIESLGGKKKVCVRLWPGDSETTAYDRIRACCAEGNKQQFKPLEVLQLKRWAHEVGSHHTVDFESRQLACRVEWLSPEDERERLQREFIAGVERLDQIKRALCTNESRIRSVK